MAKKMDMNKYFTFVLSAYHKTERTETEKEVKELNDWLEEVGICAELEISKDSDVPLLNIRIKNDIYNNRVNRNAGRNRKYDFSKDYTFADIWKWRSEGVREPEILEKLGCSHATYARRLKEAKELGFDGSEKWTG